MYQQFDLITPANLNDALEALADGDNAMALAGGTNLVVDMRAGREAPDKLVSLDRVEALRRIEVDAGHVTIGGRTTVSDILNHPEMAELAPSLFQSAQVFAGMMVRNTATVAGNICSGSPAADLVPPLLSLDAALTLASRTGERKLKLSEFYTGFKQDQRAKGELITQISWPAPSRSSANLFYKLARRKGDAITVVGVAVMIAIEDGKCATARIALGSVAPVVKRAEPAEQLLVGKNLNADIIDAAARLAVKAASPIDDLRASSQYRQHAVHVLTRRLLTQAWETASNRG
jgi:CO/xanthine dehydrogenase FAD-binding subunit